MNTITDGCCIIDALCGIDTASPQVGQFSDNFTKIKFVIKKDLHDYNILLLTDTDGEVNFIAPDDSVLIKDTDSDTGETTLLWNIGREITSKSTVVIYQIVAYKGEIDNPESTWYSKEGRLTVTQSIDSSSKSASVIGTYPNLLTRLILNIEKCRENNDILSDKKVDKEDGYGLSENNFSHKLKEKLENIEDGANVNMNPDWKETDSSKDSYIENKPSNFGSLLFVNEDMTTFEFKGDDMPVAFVQGHGIDFEVQNRPDTRCVLISSVTDNEYNSQSDLPQSGKAVKEAISLAIASLADSAPETLDTLKEIAYALNNDPDFGASIITELSKKANSKDLSKVATSGSYEDLSDKPTILSEDDVINIHRNHTYPVMRAEADTYGNKIHLTYAKKTDIVTSYNDLTDKPFSNVNWLDIDSLYGREKDGIYKVLGKEMSGTVGMGNSSSYMIVMTNVSGNVIQTCQYLIHSDGKSQYRLGTGTGIEDWSEWKSVGVTSYNDLTDKPINESISEYGTHNYNEFTTEGIYILREPFKERYKLLIVTKDNDHYDEETGEYGHADVQYIFTTYDVTKRIHINGKWTETTLSTKAYVDSAIGDVETSLENIIAKYGLGGDDV